MTFKGGVPVERSTFDHLWFRGLQRRVCIPTASNIPYESQRDSGSLDRPWTAKRPVARCEGNARIPFLIRGARKRV